MEKEIMGMLQMIHDNTIVLDTKVGRLGEKLELLETRMDIQKKELKDEMKTIEQNLSASIDSQKKEMKAIERNLSARIDSQKKEMKAIEQNLSVKIDSVRFELENVTNRKISALFDGREDELRYRRITIQNNEDIESLQMRVSNLEQALKSVI